MDSKTIPLVTSDPASPRTYRGALVIVALAALVILYALTVGIIDRGTSNIVVAITFGVMLLALGVWTIFLSPLCTQTIWTTLVVAGIVLFGPFAVVRIDGFDGNLIPRFKWRWQPKDDEALAARGLTPDNNSSTDLTPTPRDFAGFLGTNRDAYIPGVKLATDWTAAPPKVLWKQPIGAGWSGFSIVGQGAFTLEQRGEEELVTCYELTTGKLVWSHAINARHTNAIGGDGPGSTPSIHDGCVYALGGTGVLRVLEAATGKLLWQRDVLADVGSRYELDRSMVFWGRAASPLIVDDLVIVPGGGPPNGPKVSLVAYHRQTGDIVWKGGKRQVSYSSPSLATYGGVRQIVIVNEDNITAHNPATGEQLWETKWDGSSTSSASAPQSIQLADDRLFVCKGYSMGGAAVFSVTPNEGGEWSVEKLWHNRRVLKTKLNNVALRDGYAYGLSDGTLECVSLESGERQWEGDYFGHGQMLRIGDVLLVTHETGAVSLVAMEPSEFTELAQLPVLEGTTWNNPAFSSPYLLIRNAKEAACVELPVME